MAHCCGPGRDMETGCLNFPTTIYVTPIGLNSFPACSRLLLGSWSLSSLRIPQPAEAQPVQAAVRDARERNNVYIYSIKGAHYLSFLVLKTFRQPASYELTSYTLTISTSQTVSKFCSIFLSSLYMPLPSQARVTKHGHRSYIQDSVTKFNHLVRQLKHRYSPLLRR